MSSRSIRSQISTSSMPLSVVLIITCTNHNRCFLILSCSSSSSCCCCCCCCCTATASLLPMLLLLLPLWPQRLLPILSMLQHVMPAARVQVLQTLSFSLGSHFSKWEYDPHVCQGFEKPQRTVSKQLPLGVFRVPTASGRKRCI